MLGSGRETCPGSKHKRTGEELARTGSFMLGPRAGFSTGSEQTAIGAQGGGGGLTRGGDMPVMSPLNTTSLVVTPAKVPVPAPVIDALNTP